MAALLALRPMGGDVGLYEHYARLATAPPVLHSFPVEYPAAALALFLAPLGLPLPYGAGFALIVAVAVVMLVLSSDGLPGQPGWPGRVCVYLMVGTVAVLFARYDALPALAAFWGVENARRERWGRAWGGAVVGGLLKLFPFLLLPGFLFAERLQSGKWPLRRVGAALSVIAGTAAAQQLLAPGSVTSALSYELRRGFELSSVSGSLSFLADPLHARWVHAFGAVEVLGAGHSVISVAVTTAAAGALTVVWWLVWRRALSVEAAALAVLSVAVLSDKAFAPQYLIWLAPLWAYWPTRKGWVAAAALTSLVFPVLYTEPVLAAAGFRLATLAAVARNGVLVIATASWFLAEVRAGSLSTASGKSGERWPAAPLEGPRARAPDVVLGAANRTSYQGRCG